MRHESFNEIPKLLSLVGPSPWKVRINSKLAKTIKPSPIKSKNDKSVTEKISSPSIIFVPSQDPLK